MGAYINNFHFNFFNGAFTKMPSFCNCYFNFGCYSNPFTFNTLYPAYFTPYYNFFNSYSYPMPFFNTSLINLPNISVINYDWSNNFLSNIPYSPNNTYFNQNLLPSVKHETNSITFKSNNDLSINNTEIKNEFTEKSLENKHWSEMTDAELRDVYGNYDRDITKLYAGEAADLNKCLEGKGVLEGKGEVFIKAQNDYGISAAVLAAICMHESNNGKSNYAKNKNNVGGIRIAGSYEFRNFDTVDDCIEYMAELLKNYYVNNPGRSLKKLYQINAKYCPASDITNKSGNNSQWAKAVENYCNEIEKTIS